MVLTLSDETSVRTQIVNGVGWIRLNRPRALNALNEEMVKIMERQLRDWREDDQVALVCIEGEGEKGLCAGGDMRRLYELRGHGVEAYAASFFSTEYRMDDEIHRYPKPVLVYMDGVVMGGGVGISIGASHRIVTETTKWAMPEMNIGFFPDVGASWFLNQMPGCVGRYLALTSEVLRSGDLLSIGAADWYVARATWPALKQALMEKRWSPESVRQELDHLLGQYGSATAPSSTLPLQREQIDLHFRFDTVEAILSSLEKAAESGDEWAQKRMNNLRSKSPTSLKVTLRQLQLGQKRSLRECLAMELSLAMNFMKCADFYEGVRSVLVDKDRSPRWEPSTLEEITEDRIRSFFQYQWGGNGSPLVDWIDKGES